MSTSQRVSCVFSTFVALIGPTLVWAGEDKAAVLAKCKLKAMKLYTQKEELSQDAIVRASEYVVTCMIAAGYRIDPTKRVLHAMDRPPLPGASSLGEANGGRDDHAIKPNASAACANFRSRHSGEPLNLMSGFYCSHPFCRTPDG